MTDPAPLFSTAPAPSRASAATPSVPRPRQPAEASPPAYPDPEQMRPNPRRRGVGDRLVLAGQRHARHVLDRTLTGGAVPARHAVVFMFAQPAGRAGDDGLRIASRMFLAGDDVTDLAVVLTALGDRVDDYRRQTRVPLVRIVDRAEPMTREARFLGTTTSSLAASPDPDPRAPRDWLGLAHLDDGTEIVLRHRVNPDELVPRTADLDVVSTHTLNLDDALDPFVPSRVWRYGPAHDADHTDLAPVRAALARLHAVVLDSEHRPRRRKA